MADRLHSWEHKTLPNDEHEELAEHIAKSKAKPISPAVVAAFASKSAVPTSPEDRRKIAERANELIAVEFAKEGRPARS